MARGQPERLEGVGFGLGEGEVSAALLLLRSLGPLPPALDQQPRREPRGGEAGGKGGHGRVRAAARFSLSPPPPSHGGEEPLPQKGREVGGRGVPRVLLCSSSSSSFFFAVAVAVTGGAHNEKPRGRRLDVSAPPGSFREEVFPVGAREELLRRLGGLGEPAEEDEGLFEHIRVFL